MSIVLHDGRCFDLVVRQPNRDHRDVELVLEGRDGRSAGVAEVHLEPGNRAEVVLCLRPAPSADEAGTVLLAEAAEFAADHGAVELLAPHVAGDPHAAAILDGVGLGYDERADATGATAVIDLVPLLAWQALAPTA